MFFFVVSMRVFSGLMYTATETYKMSKHVYINKALFHVLVFEWFKRVIKSHRGL